MIKEKLYIFPHTSVSDACMCDQKKVFYFLNSNTGFNKIDYKY